MLCFIRQPCYLCFVKLGDVETQLLAVVITKLVSILLHIIIELSVRIFCAVVPVRA